MTKYSLKYQTNSTEFQQKRVDGNPLFGFYSSIIKACWGDFLAEPKVDGQGSDARAEYSFRGAEKVPVDSNERSTAQEAFRQKLAGVRELLALLKEVAKRGYRCTPDEFSKIARVVKEGPARGLVDKGSLDLAVAVIDQAMPSEDDLGYLRITVEGQPVLIYWGLHWTKRRIAPPPPPQKEKTKTGKQVSPPPASLPFFITNLIPERVLRGKKLRIAGMGLATVRHITLGGVEQKKLLSKSDNALELTVDPATSTGMQEIILEATDGREARKNLVVRKSRLWPWVVLYILALLLVFWLAWLFSHRPPPYKRTPTRYGSELPILPWVEGLEKDDFVLDSLPPGSIQKGKNFVDVVEVEDPGLEGEGGGEQTGGSFGIGGGSRGGYKNGGESEERGDNITIVIQGPSTSETPTPTETPDKPLPLSLDTPTPTETPDKPLPLSLDTPTPTETPGGPPPPPSDTPTPTPTDTPGGPPPPPFDTPTPTPTDTPGEPPPPPFDTPTLTPTDTPGGPTPTPTKTPPFPVIPTKGDCEKTGTDHKWTRDKYEERTGSLVPGKKDITPIPTQTPVMSPEAITSGDRLEVPGGEWSILAREGILECGVNIRIDWDDKSRGNGVEVSYKCGEPAGIFLGNGAETSFAMAIMPQKESCLTRYRPHNVPRFGNLHVYKRSPGTPDDRWTQLMWWVGTSDGSREFRALKSKNNNEYRVFIPISEETINEPIRIELRDPLAGERLVCELIRYTQ